MPGLATVTNTQSNVAYVGTGDLSVYSYPFRIFQATDLVLSEGSTVGLTILSLNTDYTVSGAGNYPGGSVSLLAGPLASGVTLNIYRIESLTQQTSFRNQGAFFPARHEDAYDKLTMITQQLQNQITQFQIEASLTPLPIYTATPTFTPSFTLTPTFTPTLTPTSTFTPTNTSTPSNLSFNGVFNPTPTFVAAANGCWMSVGGSGLTITSPGLWEVQAAEYFKSGNTSTVTINTMGYQFSSAIGTNTQFAPAPFSTPVFGIDGMSQMTSGDNNILGFAATQFSNASLFGTDSHRLLVQAPATIFYVPFLQATGSGLCVFAENVQARFLHP